MEPDTLLPILFASSVMGVGVLDKQMRFRAVNGALAAMNGIPATKHLGRKLRHILGPAASKLEAATDQVLCRGELVSVDVTAELPSRAGLGHWKGSFFPIRDLEGHVVQVGGVVLEITDKKNWERSLEHMLRNLNHIRGALKTELQFLDGKGEPSEERSILLTQTAKLAKRCIAEAQALYRLARHDPSVDIPQLQCLDAMDLESLTGTSISDSDKREQSEADNARRLSRRERGVLQLLADGKNNKEVGVLLGISMRTVECYRARLMRKVDIHTLAHLVRFAVRSKIIEA